MRLSDIGRQHVCRSSFNAALWAKCLQRAVAFWFRRNSTTYHSLTTGRPRRLRVLPAKEKLYDECWGRKRIPAKQLAHHHRHYHHRPHHHRLLLGDHDDESKKKQTKKEISITCTGEHTHASSPLLLPPLFSSARHNSVKLNVIWKTNQPIVVGSG